MGTKLSIKELELLVTKFFEAVSTSKFGALKSKKNQTILKIVNAKSLDFTKNLTPPRTNRHHHPLTK